LCRPALAAGGVAQVLPWLSWLCWLCWLSLRRARSSAIMTRVAKLSDTSRTSPLAATRSPVEGLADAPNALLSARVASTATRTRSQNQR